MKPNGRTNVEAEDFIIYARTGTPLRDCYGWVSAVSLCAYIIKPNGRTNVEAEDFIMYARTGTPLRDRCGCVRACVRTHAYMDLHLQ